MACWPAAPRIQGTALQAGRLGRLEMQELGAALLAHPRPAVSLPLVAGMLG